MYEAILFYEANESKIRIFISFDCMNLNGSVLILVK